MKLARHCCRTSFPLRFKLATERGVMHEGESPPIMEDRYKEIKKMAQNKKTTGTKAASSASKTLTSKSTGAKSKASSGNALSQTGAPKRQTSSKAASAASATLRDGRTSKAAKSAAGSALAQTPSKKKK